MVAAKTVALSQRIESLRQGGGVYQPGRSTVTIVNMIEMRLVPRS